MIAAQGKASFALHSRLAADTHLIGDLPLCRVLLMNDARFPWLILVPRREKLHDITDLSVADSTVLMDEVRLSCRALRDILLPDRINVAAIGNIVDQLHIHVVARTITDPAWPGTVWGHGGSKPYDDPTLLRRRNELLPRLKLSH
jgi:diadenosine tetraphosphate (Ap4A) HIT family hydrolase